MSDVIDYYSGFDEWGRLDREPIEFLVNWHYMRVNLPPSGLILDNGAGPGKYSMELARLGYKVTLTDLTPRVVEIAKSKALEEGLEDKFDGFHVQNATNLSELADETYDASLMLGPLYHLQQEDQRIKAVRELHRVTKQKGVVFVAFRSRVRMLLTSLQSPLHWKPHDSLDSITDFSETGIFNHREKGRFTGAYFFDVEEIQPFMESNGFETIDLIGSTNLGASLTNEQLHYWAEQGEEEYMKLLNLLIGTAKDKSILGLSSHLLYIGKKK